MLVGISLSALFFLAGAFVSSLLPLAAVIFLFSIFFNVAVDPYTALLADIVPLEHRGWLSGLSTGVQLVSSVAFLLVVYFATANGAAIPLWTYPLVAAILVVSFGITIVQVHEPRSSIELARHVPLRSYIEAVTEHRQAVRYLGTLFVYQFGLNAILPYLVLFVVEDIHQTNQVAFGLSAALLVVTALGAIVFGRLADRIGTRQVMALGWALLAVSAVGGVVVTDLPQTTLVVLVAGVGNGAATAASWPLLTALIPADKTGVFAGLKAAAESIAIPLSVVVAAEVFLPNLGYRGVFAMLAINIVLALALLLAFVHPRRGGETGQTRRT
jgi:MFS-type transporter involved in bile tolerance (Atg22 family)